MCYRSILLWIHYRNIQTRSLESRLAVSLPRSDVLGVEHTAVYKVEEFEVYVYFFRSIPANMLVCLAIFLAISSEDIMSKIVGMYLPVACFARYRNLTEFISHSSVWVMNILSPICSSSLLDWCMVLKQPFGDLCTEIWLWQHLVTLSVVDCAWERCHIICTAVEAMVNLKNCGNGVGFQLLKK